MKAIELIINLNKIVPFQYQNSKFIYTTTTKKKDVIRQKKRNYKKKIAVTIFDFKLEQIKKVIYSTLHYLMTTTTKNNLTFMYTPRHTH
jgi:hypothetical protein